MELGLICYIRDLYWFHARREDNFVKTRELYRMFVRQFGLHIDLEVLAHPRGWSISSIPMLISDNKHLDRECIMDLLASQPLPLDQWPASQRASTGLGSRGWPVDIFLKVVNLDKYPEMLTQTDSRGRIALHWAAEHCGRWSCSSLSSYDDDVTVYREQKEGYRKLVTKLIALGTDIHKLDKNGHSPFSAYCNSLDWRLLRFDNVNLPSDHIRLWGELVSLGGLSLSEYARRENEQLQTLDRAQRTTRHVVLDTVELSEDSELTVHMTAYTSVNIWQPRLAPGAWERPLLDKVISIGELRYPFPEKPDLWVKTATQEVVAGRCQRALTSQTPGLPLKHESVYEAWQGLFSGSQDDHSLLTKVMSDDFGRGRKGQRSPTGRRAKSYSRIVTPWPDRSPFEPPTCPTVTFERWPLHVHKCFLNAKWIGHVSTGLHPLPDEAACMLGLCGFLNYRGLVWEDFFIREDDNIDKVCRFVDRFRPQDRKWLDQRLAGMNQNLQ
jgi:hypothetical protein